MEAMLALEDGRIFRGRSFGAPGENAGEIVFNTSMCGYQEILTDPSYRGQIVTMTYPMIGNYGVNQEDVESNKPQVEGFVVKEYIPYQSNWRATESLQSYLVRNQVVAMEGVDTRALTRHIRTAGAMKAVISTRDLDAESMVKKAKASPGLVGRDLVKEVTCQEPYQWSKEGDFSVAVIDCGVKFNILRDLAGSGCRVRVYPAHTSSQDILADKHDGLFLSNGPGDPAGVPYVVETVRALVEKLPVFGICLGHQMLGLALGGKTYKLKFGHRGGNQPVKDLRTGKVDITSQNHGFCVDMNTLDEKEVELTHINPNDETLEGIRHQKLPVFSVQYHPEASPGPHDANYLFQQYIDLMKKHR